MSTDHIPREAAQELMEEIRRGARSGAIWSQAEVEALKNSFKHRGPLADFIRTASKNHHRSVRSILMKLQELELIKQNLDSLSYEVTTKQITQENTMSTTPNFERKEVVMIRGRDAAELTDDQIFSMIATIKGEIQQLKLTNNEINSKKMANRITQLTEDLANLVMYVDARA